MTLVALVAFLMMVTTGAVLLLVALVIWVAELLGSLMLATLVVGGVSMLAAALIYVAALRRGLRTLRERVETVYDVAQSLREAYRWVIDKFHWLLLLRGAMATNEKGGTK